jgi:hypothetical protein
MSFNFIKKIDLTYISETAVSTFNYVPLSHVIPIEPWIMSHDYVILNLQHIFLRHLTHSHLSGRVTFTKKQTRTQR